MARKKDELDDGRVIVNMDVDGMPWTKPSLFESAAGRFAREDIRKMREQRLAREDKGLASPLQEFSKQEIKQFTRNSVLAGLLIGVVYMLGLVLFILFCVYVWLR
ncbi:MAG: hypothetical protein GX314_04715 [Clostridiaceae bacterium]|nr:hypothetical protein [Clostridiaceae bacterium]